jgi:hypothetical protein
MSRTTRAKYGQLIQFHGTTVDTKYVATRRDPGFVNQLPRTFQHVALERKFAGQRIHSEQTETVTKQWRRLINIRFVMERKPFVIFQSKQIYF